MIQRPSGDSTSLELEFVCPPFEALFVTNLVVVVDLVVVLVELESNEVSMIG